MRNRHESFNEFLSKFETHQPAAAAIYHQCKFAPLEHRLRDESEARERIESINEERMLLVSEMLAGKPLSKLVQRVMWLKNAHELLAENAGGDQRTVQDVTAIENILKGTEKEISAPAEQPDGVVIGHDKQPLLNQHQL